MKKRILSALVAAAMLVTTNASLWQSAYADDENIAEETKIAEEAETAEDRSLITEEPMSEPTYEQEETDTPNDEITQNIVSGGIVLTPDESVLNNPVMTPENRAKLEAYEQKLTAEMEAEGYDFEQSISLFSTSIPTFQQYLADYNYNYNCYSFYKNEFNLPYRGFVETKRNSNVYQGLLGAWRVATFNLSDFAKYSTKEIGFYETILFDVLYQGKDVESLSGMMKDCVDSVEASTLKKVADMMGKNIQEVTMMDLDSVSDEDFEALSSSFQSCEELTDVFGAIGNISKVLGYVDNVEQLIYKLAKAQVISEHSNETAKILLAMKNYTSNEAMKCALDNLILACSETVSEASVIAMFSSEMVVSELLDYVLGEIWTCVLDQLTLYGYAVNAGQALGKTLSHWLFSTDEDIEMYYSLCALYEFEDALKSAMGAFESNYKSSKSDANSSVFNECYKMLLRTYLFGAKASQEYVDIEYKHGAINELLFCFKEEKYNDYTTKLNSLKSNVEQTIEFMDTIAYNGYLEEYCVDAAPLVNAEQKQDNYTKEEKEETIVLLSALSLETSSVTIEEDYKLNTDIHTYGSLTLKGGTLDLNGHTLTVDGSILQTGGTMDINAGRLIVGGNYEIAGSVTTNGAGEREYTNAYGATLNMTLSNDYVLVNGDFATYSGKSHRGCLTNGIFELKGDFKQLGTPTQSTEFQYAYAFCASDEHTVIFSGKDQQSIFFECPERSGFANVEFKNTNIKLNSGIRGFTLNNDIDLTLGTDKININGTVNLNGHSITNKSVVEKDTLTYNSGNITLDGTKLKINGDLYITGGTLGMVDTIVTGNLYLQGGTLDLNGHTLTVDGSILQTGGTMDINAGRLIVGGNYEIAGSVTTNGAGEREYTNAYGATLNMTLSNDYVLVNGDFATYSGKSHRGCLTNGIFELKGDFKQLGTPTQSTEFQYAYAFCASDEHTVIFSGEGQQSIFFECPECSGFANVEFKNSNSIAFTTAISVRNILCQSGGAEIINPNNAILNGKTAFTDCGDLNIAINKYVGNAENVTPTYKDYEAYISQADEPKYPYIINDISLKSTSGNNLDRIPTNENFIVDVSLSKQKQRDEKDYIFVAVYDTNGVLLSIDYVQAKFVENYTYSFGFNISAQTSEVGSIKAFVWHTFDSMQPLCESKTL